MNTAWDLLYLIATWLIFHEGRVLLSTRPEWLLSQRLSGLSRGRGLARLDALGCSNPSIPAPAPPPPPAIVGIWHGSVVAVKALVLPASPAPAHAKQQRMAVMESVISSSLSHPNIVQTFTYRLTTINCMQRRVGAGEGAGHMVDQHPQRARRPR